MRSVTTSFAVFSALILASWLMSRFSQLLAPPREEHLAIRLILLWSFYPGALIWTALFGWCEARAPTWGGWRAVRVFWLASLATAPIPLLIHWALIVHDREVTEGLYAHIGEGAVLIFLLPVVSVILSTLVAVALARKLGVTPSASR